jgi:hypothetical protein
MPAINPLFSGRLRTHWRSSAGAAGRCASIAEALHDDKSGVRSGNGMAVMAEVAYPLRDSEISAHDYRARL